MECLNENENEVNDSYILKEDKLNLIRTIKNIYKNSMPWADDALMSVLVKEHYKNVINNMNEEDYKNDIKNVDLDYLVKNT
jgi:hypothetical protein